MTVVAFALMAAWKLFFIFILFVFFFFLNWYFGGKRNEKFENLGTKYLIRWRSLIQAGVRSFPDFGSFVSRKKKNVRKQITNSQTVT